ncbi:MAG: NAD(P)H-binding protein [Inquilinaceae bacterium]
MRVLVVGAGGFIGAAVTAALAQAGHAVVAAGRDTARLGRRFPDCDHAAIDLVRSLEPEDWVPHLTGVDAVVNCAGLLQAPKAVMEAVHHRAPAALFDACARQGVRRVIHVSAISVTEEAGTDYAISKLRGEEALRRSGLDWILLRPSLVWSPAGSYGGTSALRGLAALPWIVPTIGRGDQPFTPITTTDLARGVVRLLAADAPIGSVFEPGGPETLTMVEITVRLRAWLGLPAAWRVAMPIGLVRVLCRLGDVMRLGPLTTTSLKQIEHGNQADPATFVAAIGFEPDSMDAALAVHPAQEQDLWHARLYFAEPVLRIALILLWTVSGLTGLAMSGQEVAALLRPLPGPDALLIAMGRAAAILDIALAILIAIGWRPGLVAAAQVAVVATYTLLLSVLAPSLWLEPFGPLLKNLPILVLIPIHAALAMRR